MRLCSPLSLRASILGSIVGAAITTIALPHLSASAASTIYYCPDRKGDQQYSAQRGPGCIPLVDEGKKTPEERSSQRRAHLENLQQDVSLFLSRYQKFLDCCKTDLTELGELEAIADQLDELLASAQANLSNYSLASRGIMLRELIPRVAKARTDLKVLHARLEKMNDLSNRLDQLDFEESGRQSQTIRELQESIDRDVPAPVITLSLQMRFRSRQPDSYGAKVLAALRNEFGGHEVKTE